jgi:capsular polysaccharide export protein
MKEKSRGISGQDRRFLMLQGPHGPFFRTLGRMLVTSGAEVWRVGFNRGDEFFWGLPGYIPFDAPAESWPTAFATICDEKRVTDLVLYGDSRRIHSEAMEIARKRKITVHIFEEGYLRPYWATYERGATNGGSRLIEMSIEDMRRALNVSGDELPEAPARWGDMRQHVFYGALYHFMVLALNRRYRHFRPHRGVTIGHEFRLHLRRLLLMPLHRIERVIATARVHFGGFPYHLVLLQLEHDASFQSHSDFSSMGDFVETCLAGFAEGAPPHHHIVFKAHPLEDERAGIVALIRGTANRLGIRNRVHFVRGGKLARLLDGARSAVTVNSTAGQQVLWRGLPLMALGRAVYCKPEFVPDQTLPEFFAAPARPDIAAYRDFRRYLLETSQVPGGFYSSRGRRYLLRQVIDMVLAREDPYDSLSQGKAARRQQLAGEPRED